MKVSVVIPVYRNEGAITKTFEKLEEVFRSMLSECEYELIFVDDGSDDNSLNEILALRERDRRVKAISFTRNFGQMSAMLAGLKEASGDVIINISADMQDPADLIPQMVNRWKDGSEIVICHRTDRKDNYSARLFSKLAYGFLRLSMPEIPPGGFDYVLLDSRVQKEFNSIDVRNRFFQGDLLWMGFKCSFIPYTRQKREIGKSQYTFEKKLKNFLDAFLDSSYLSIRFISLCGVLTAFLGVLYSVSILIAWAFGSTPFSGWAPIMIAILLVGGLIMVMLGVIGEYVWRIYDEVRKKPNYIIRQSYLEK